MIPLEEALDVVDRHAHRLHLPSESVPVRQAAGRVLATDQQSNLDLPPFDKAAVDGYAVGADDGRTEYTVAGAAAVGEPCTAAIAPGQAFKVMTGAPVPQGAARVVMLEHAIERGIQVRFRSRPAARNVCRRSEEIAQGQVVVPGGTKLGPLEIACLISCGVTEVDVVQPVRLAIINTGREIVDSPADLSCGRIMNSNGPLLAELARNHALSVSRVQRVTDDLPAIVAALQQAMADAEMVVLTGGVSVGELDLVPEALAACGLSIQFARVAIKPGRPTTFATDNRRLVFGLAGNPVAVFVTFHLFVLRAAARLAGAAYEFERFKIRLADDFARQTSDRTEYVPCRISRDSRAEQVAYRGPAHLTALVRADGFLMIPRGTTSLPAGTECSVALFREA